MTPGAAGRAGLVEAEATFLRACPGYAGTRALDALRAREFSRLDERGAVYLDYTGSGLYAASQVRRHADMLLSEVLGNPHSLNPPPRAAPGWSSAAGDACSPRARCAHRLPSDDAA